MPNHFKGQRTQRSEPTQRELFMGGKDAEFAVFFNVAFTKVLRTVHFWKTGVIEFDEEKLDTLYGTLLDQFEQSRHVADDLSDEMYAKLRNYIWKGYLSERNSSGYTLAPEDKTRIRQLLCKLRALRNFHGHVYHDNAEIDFQPELRDFILRLHDDAMYLFSEKHPEEVEFYQKNLLEHPLFKQGRYITQEGRTFFLSLFLTTGEVSRLLQQRRGSKKNDELRFRIKHSIYRHYAHRDGAARKYYNLEENLHDTLTEQELAELLNAQKFYRLNVQANDTPEFLHDTGLFPLFFQQKNGELAPCETVQDLQLFCRQQRIATALAFHPVLKKDSEEEKTGVIRFGIPADYTQPFEVKRSDFHRIVLDFIRLGEEAMLERLGFFLQERKTLRHALEQPDPENHLGMSGDTPIALMDYEKYKLRGSRRLREDFTEWLMGYENKHKKQEKWLGFLKTRLASAPIELRHFDLYQVADQKPRTADRFIEQCVDYLMDFGITPNWHWAFETFRTETKTDPKTGAKKEVLRKVIEFHPRCPDTGNWRLCVDSSHILVKLRGEGRPFAFGENALRNLMVAVTDRLDKPNSDAQNLLDRIQADLQTVEAAAQSGKPLDFSTLQLLDSDTLPEVLLLRTGATQPANWLRKTQNRVAHIIGVLADLQKDKTGLSRADRNEQVMRCYQFFDWNPKFLRQNEYQQLSIFHYSLERMTAIEDEKSEAKRRRDDRSVRAAERNLRYYYALLEGIRAENLNRIPPEVDKVLRNATSLDDLLDRIIATTLGTLRRWEAVLKRGPRQEQEAIAQRLKIHRDTTASLDAAYPASIPFSIHPVLIVKAFYPKNANPVNRISLSKIVRDNTALVSALRPSNYDWSAYAALAAQWPEAVRKKVSKKITGASDRATAHDALRWHFASRYFERISPNVRMAFGSDGALPARVDNLRRSTLHIPVTTDAGHAVRVELYFHQLDDTLFVESKNMLTKLVDYLYRRRAEDPVRYAEVHDDHLAYGEITKEMARLQNDALVIARHLLDWENRVLEGLTDAALLQNATPPGKGLRRIGFRKVCQVAQLSDSDANTLSNLRNHVFHMKVPTQYTYRSIAQDPAIRRLLGDIVFQKDRSQWEKPAPQDAKND